MTIDDYIHRMALSTAQGSLSTFQYFFKVKANISIEHNAKKTQVASAVPIDFKTETYKIYFNENVLSVLYRYIVGLISNDRLFDDIGYFSGKVRFASVNERDVDIIGGEMNNCNPFGFDETKQHLINHIFNTVVMMITLHEFFHISRGHLKLLFYAIPKGEYILNDKGFPSYGTLRKTLEYDADRNAIRYLYAFYASIYMDKQLIPGIVCDETFHRKIVLFSIYFTHSVITLQLGDVDNFRANVYHPTAYMRIMASFGDLIGFWAKRGNSLTESLHEYKKKKEEVTPFINYFKSEMARCFNLTFESTNSFDDFKSLPGSEEEKLKKHFNLMREYGFNWNDLYEKLQEYSYVELEPLVLST